jgi:hypothetical protein
MKATIDTNKKSWFVLDENLKKYQDADSSDVKKTSSKGILQRQNKDMNKQNNLEVSARYMKAVRDAFSSLKGV